jgi:hypothetical protein
MDKSFSIVSVNVEYNVGYMVPRIQVPGERLSGFLHKEFTDCPDDTTLLNDVGFWCSHATD